MKSSYLSAVWSLAAVAMVTHAAGAPQPPPTAGKSAEGKLTAGAPTANAPKAPAVSEPAANPSKSVESPKPAPEKVSADAPNILVVLAHGLIWSHLGISGHPTVKTPHLDRLAAEGMRFTHAFAASPSSGPALASLLTGRPIGSLEEAANQWGPIPASLPVYPLRLEAAGYRIGTAGMGWGPLGAAVPAPKKAPTGPGFASLRAFLAATPSSRPFCFWYGSRLPARPFAAGSAARAGKKPDAVVVPGFLPDAAAVRGDLLDYEAAVEQFDTEVGGLLGELTASGMADRTIVVVTSTGAMPFPRAESGLYDHSVRVPLLVRWPGRVEAGRVMDEPVSQTDLAPTLYSLAGLSFTVSGGSRPLLSASERQGDPKEPVGKKNGEAAVTMPREGAYFGRERHADCRGAGAGYPQRGVRTRKYLYIRTYEPSRWPAGDPPKYGEVTESPTRAYLLKHKDEENVAPSFGMAFERRPAEELYDVEKDPFQIHNLARLSAFLDEKRRHADLLDRWLKESEDGRAGLNPESFDRFPFANRKPASSSPAPVRSAAKKPIIRQLPRQVAPVDLDIPELRNQPRRRTRAVGIAPMTPYRPVVGIPRALLIRRGGGARNNPFRNRP